MYRLLLVAGVLAGAVLAAWAAEKDSPAAAATRKKLETMLTVEYKDVRLDDLMKDLAEKVKEASGKDLSFKLDNKGGVSNNLTLTLSAQDKSLADILDALFKKNDLGYIVINKEYEGYKGGRYDGWLLIVKGKARGYPPGQEAKAEPGKAKKPAKAEKPDKGAKAEKPDKPEKPEKPEKSAKTEKPEKPEPAEKPADDPDRNERRAANRLEAIKDLIQEKKTARAKERLADLLKEFPDTKAAKEAKKLLRDLD